MKPEPRSRLRRWWTRAVASGFIESPASSTDLDRAMRQAAHPVLSFYLLLMLSAVIATLGLLANSAAVIIGAMIIAPLMNPLMALAFGATRADWRLCAVALFTLSTGVGITVLFAYLMTILVGLQVPGSEIVGRGQATLLDLGIAVAAGAAAALAYSRHSIANTLAGTAIAVALVPPLCVVGVGLELASRIVPEPGFEYVPLGPSATGLDFAKGAFRLFLANLIGIVLAAQLVLLSQGYGSVRKGILGFSATVLTAALLIRPLGIPLQILYSQNAALKVSVELGEEALRQAGPQGDVLSVRAYYTAGQLHVDAKLMAPEQERASMPDVLKMAQERLSRRLGEPVRLNVDVMFVPMARYELLPDPDPN